MYLSPKDLENYHIHTISKPNGGTRRLIIPNLKQKQKQKDLLPLLQQFPLGDHIYGVKGTSIREHSQVHGDAPVILKMDVKAFFDTVTNQHFYDNINHALDTHQISYDLYSDLSTAASDFFLTKGHLPTGSPTSPLVAIISFIMVDEYLNALAAEHKMYYTRYMDDLIFSGESYPAGLQSKVNTAVHAGGFSINHKKSQILYRGSHSQTITGVMAGTVPTIPRAYSRRLRAELDNIAQYANHLNPVLRGKLAYVKQINKSQYKSFSDYFFRRVKRYNED